eukprot:1942020-Prymnesium_polylepis.3
MRLLLSSGRCGDSFLLDCADCDGEMAKPGDDCAGSKTGAATMISRTSSVDKSDLEMVSAQVRRCRRCAAGGESQARIVLGEVDTDADASAGALVRGAPAHAALSLTLQAAGQPEPSYEREQPPRWRRGRAQKVPTTEPGAPPVRFASVREEYAARCAYCTADYTTTFSFISKSLSAALFMFFATLFSTVALGAHLQLATGNRIGLSEYLVMNSVSGVLYALLGTQPMLIVRPTGPVTAIVAELCSIASMLQIDPYQLLAATGICVSILMFVIAFTGISNFLHRLTPFTHEIFSCFVCSLYLYDGISDVIVRFVVDVMRTVTSDRAPQAASDSPTIGSARPPRRSIDPTPPNSSAHHPLATGHGRLRHITL